MQDELGSPIRLVDSKGKTTERYSYDEFGTPIGLKMALGLSKSSNPFGFTGYQYDTSIGLYFAQARYYAAGDGRFISEDAYEGDITNPLSLNQYTYVSNNPLRYVDPTGHWQQSDASYSYAVQNYLLDITILYHFAETDSERQAIHARAEEIRTKMNYGTGGFLNGTKKITEAACDVFSNWKYGQMGKR